MGALDALVAGLRERKPLTWAICLVEISIALGPHDTKLGSQRELTKRSLPWPVAGR